MYDLVATLADELQQVDDTQAPKVEQPGETHVEALRHWCKYQVIKFIILDCRFVVDLAAACLLSPRA